MDRKYRQKGYMDSNKERPAREGPGRRPETFGPRTPNLPGSRSVLRCASCAAVLPTDIDTRGNCPRCGFSLHSCQQCANFDTSARFECTQPIPERIEAGGSVKIRALLAAMECKSAARAISAGVYVGGQDCCTGGTT